MKTIALIVLLDIALVLALYFLIKKNREIIQLKKKNDDMARAMHNVCHDMRNPLNSILGFADILSQPDGFLSEKEKKEYAAHIKNGGAILHMLMNDILYAADIQDGNYAITPIPTSISEIDNTVEMIIRRSVPQGVMLNITTDINANESFTADPRRIQQILVNLLSNACKHTEQGQISLHSFIENDMLTFTVCDTGCGVPEKDADLIFERYSKLDHSKKGIGIGLPICREMAEKMNGKIWLDTSYTGGAKFVLSLPVKQA